MSLLVCTIVVLAGLPLVMTLLNLPVFRVPRQRIDAETGVSILIPARNEADGIAVTVRAALASRGVSVEVVVLDDDSIDGTAEAVETLSKHDARLRLVRATPLPPGWTGKQRACHLLSEHARHEILMFIDADVRVSPDAAARAAAHLVSDPRLGMVSGFPKELAISLGERLAIPWIHLLLLGYLPMFRMRRSTAPAFAAACGQWIVARRDAYRAVGGHAARPTSRHDGISLPRTFRAGGWRTDVFDGGSLASCRMYEDLPSLWRGFGKSAGEGMATPAALPVWTVLIAGGHVMPWLLLLAGAGSGDAPLTLAGGAGVAANLIWRCLLCWRLGQSWVGACLHPVGAVLLLAIQWAALVRHLGGQPSVWRGRRYGVSGEQQ